GSCEDGTIGCYHPSITPRLYFVCRRFVQGGRRAGCKRRCPKDHRKLWSKPVVRPIGTAAGNLRRGPKFRFVCPGGVPQASASARTRSRSLSTARNPKLPARAVDGVRTRDPELGNAFGECPTVRTACKLSHSFGNEKYHQSTGSRPISPPLRPCYAQARR